MHAITNAGDRVPEITSLLLYMIGKSVLPQTGKKKTAHQTSILESEQLQVRSLAVSSVSCHCPEAHDSGTWSTLGRCLISVKKLKLVSKGNPRDRRKEVKGLFKSLALEMFSL